MGHMGAFCRRANEPFGLVNRDPLHLSLAPGLPDDSSGSFLHFRPSVDGCRFVHRDGSINRTKIWNVVTATNEVDRWDWVTQVAEGWGGVVDDAVADMAVGCGNVDILDSSLTRP